MEQTLARPCIIDLARTHVSLFPTDRQKSFGFKEHRLGPEWLRSFSEFRLERTLCRRLSLEAERTHADPRVENIKTHVL